MILSIIDTLSEIIDNIKIFLDEIFGIFPAEITVVLTTVLTVLLALYIYKLLR